MDQTNDHYAYRCLPLVIANQWGWDIINPTEFDVQWDGGPDKSNIVFLSNPKPNLVHSHFHHGILTFNIQYVFRTPPDTNLLIMGCPNSPKDGIYPLTGVVEADWIYHSFTMNYLFTRPGCVKFEAGEPFCRIIPVGRTSLELTPEIRQYNEIEDYQKYKAWSKSRDKFNKDLSLRVEDVVKQGWQKDYLKQCHQTKIDLRPFVNQASRDLSCENKD